MARHLATRYGDAVQVEYCDLADPKVQAEHQEMFDNIRAKGWPLPVVTIDGSVISLGYVGFWDIVDAIEARLNR